MCLDVCDFRLCLSQLRTLNCRDTTGAFRSRQVIHGIDVQRYGVTKSTSVVETSRRALTTVCTCSLSSLSLDMESIIIIHLVR